MQELKERLINIVIKRLEKEKNPSKKTLELIDRIIKMNSFSQNPL